MAETKPNHTSENPYALGTWYIIINSDKKNHQQKENSN